MRLLKAEEIECKIATINAKGVQLLLYKTARTDMDLLDEEFGPMNWKCSYQEIKGNLYCTIEIYDKEKGEWIAKQDCGIESAFGDKEKGEASDAFKRSGFKVGIGRELYSSPFIWVSADKVKIDTEKKKCYENFDVASIDYDENRKIKSLAITDSKGVVVYSYGTNVKTPKTSVKTPQTNDLDDLKKSAVECGVNLEKLAVYLKKNSIDDLSKEDLENAISKKKARANVNG